MTQDRTNRRTEAWLGRADGRLASRLRFLLEADKLKTVIRGSRIDDGSRPENTAEHSWHIALFALVLAPHAAEPVDLLRVVSMLLIHDLVEIDSGDTPLFDPAGAATQAGREAAAVEAVRPAARGSGGRVPRVMGRVRGCRAGGRAVRQGDRPLAANPPQPRGRRRHLDGL